MLIRWRLKSCSPFHRKLFCVTAVLALLTKFYFTCKNVKDSTERLVIDVCSSAKRASIAINGQVTLDDYRLSEGRGMHIVILNQYSGAVMGRRLFNTHEPHDSDELLNYLRNVSTGRLVILTVKYEAAAGLELPARQLISEILGSTMVHQLSFRSMWILVAYLSGELWFEHISQPQHVFTWGDPITAHVVVQLRPATAHGSGDYPTDNITKFCSLYEGYANSICKKPYRKYPPAPNQFGMYKWRTDSIPIVVMSSNRPHYLLRSLTSLFQAHGFQKDNVVVFSDSDTDESANLARFIFELRVIETSPPGVGSARISQHYKLAVRTTFNLFLLSNFAIILEEDLEVSRDILSYFHQLLPVLEEDHSLWCISAWNDIGYKHTSAAWNEVYRVEGMPGLGWVIPRKIFDELEPLWPDPSLPWDWDMWMRTPQISKGRECLVPDISRTFHFGISGAHMNRQFHETYFGNHAFNIKDRVVQFANSDRLYEPLYHKYITSMIENATVINLRNTATQVCSPDFTFDQHGDFYVIYIVANSTYYDNWLKLAKCWKIWDLDVRAQHHMTWRLHWIGRPVIVVAYPASMYSKQMPSGVQPFEF